MRLGHWTWLTILLLALLGGGPTIHRALAASTDPLNDASLLPLHATLARQDASPPAVYFDSDASLSLELGTDKPAYLVGETVEITVKTNLKDTRVRLSAQYEGGSKQEVTSATISSSKTVEWTATKAGRVELVGEGSAEVTTEEWTTCTGVYCDPSGRCSIYTYPCKRTVTKTVTNKTARTLRIYPRETYISGRVVDKLQKPVAGAVVTLQSSRQTTTTDRDGYYQFPSYELGTNYTLVDNVPTVTETVTVEAVACEPVRQSIQVKASSGAPNSDFTLERFFYPPAIDLSKFALDRFSGWAKARDPKTWQNMLAVAVKRPAELKRISFRANEVSYKAFTIGEHTLYFVEDPKVGNYNLIVENSSDGRYDVAVSATLNGQQIEQGPSYYETKPGQELRLVLTVESSTLKISRSKAIHPTLIIIPIMISLAAGLAVAFFVTGGKLEEAKRAVTAGVRLPKLAMPVFAKRPLLAAAKGVAEVGRKEKRKVKRTRKLGKRVAKKPGKVAESRTKSQTKARASAKPRAETGRASTAKDVPKQERQSGKVSETEKLTSQPSSESETRLKTGKRATKGTRKTEP